MVKDELKKNFEQLHQLLIDERQAVISLDMEALEASTQAKKELLASIENIPRDTEGLKSLFLEIDKENRRNAYLLWAGLGWVREMMGFFGQSTATTTYGNIGQASSCQHGGRLLSGKV